MADVLFPTLCVEWSPKLWASVRLDANGYAVFIEPVAEDVNYSFLLAFLGIGAAIGQPEYRYMPIK